MNPVRRYFGLCLNILVPVIVTVLICVLGPKLISFFMPMLIGFLVAMIAAPLVRFLEKRVKVMRGLSSIVIIVGTIALIIVLFWSLISFLITKGMAFINDFPNLYQNFTLEMNHTIRQVGALLHVTVTDENLNFDDVMESLGIAISNYLTNFSQPAMQAAGSFAKSIPNVIVYTLVALLSSYFFLADYDKLSGKLNDNMPAMFVKWGRVAKRVSGHIVGGYFLAQFRIMLVIFVILAAALTVVGVSYSGLVAFVIAFLDFLPFFGTGTILGPWALVKLLNGNYGMALFFIVLYAITQLVRQLIQPKLLGDTMGMNPLLTLFFLFVGYKVNGFTGMILAVPIGMIFVEAVRMGAYDSMIDGFRILYRDLRNTMRASRGLEPYEKNRLEHIMKFTKMHGIGNDYVYVNCFEENVENPSEVAIAISPRHFAVGSDGLILIKPSKVADCCMEMYNADGSLGAMCGNGVRCVGKYAYDHGIVPAEKTTITVETGSGIKTLKLTVENGKAVMAEVDMGSAVLTSHMQTKPLAKEDYKTLSKDAVWETIQVDGKDWQMISISMGNPHAVVYVDDVDNMKLSEIGPEFENHERFPDRTNTEFIQIVDDHTLKMRVWERGSGETLACGTGACATLAASTLAGYVDGKADIVLLGGTLHIELNPEDGHVMMTGPAEEAFTGEWNK